MEERKIGWQNVKHQKKEMAKEKVNVNRRSIQYYGKICRISNQNC